MSQQELLDEIALLPDEARHQVEDFIAYLRQQYAAVPSDRTAQKVNLVEEEVFGMWQDREDMADSTAWVRNLRKNEWSKSNE